MEPFLRALVRLAVVVGGSVVAVAWVRALDRAGERLVGVVAPPDLEPVVLPPGDGPGVLVESSPDPVFVFADPADGVVSEPWEEWGGE